MASPFGFSFFHTPSMSPEVLLDDPRFTINADYYKKTLAHKRIAQYEVAKIEVFDLRHGNSESAKAITLVSDSQVYTILQQKEEKLDSKYEELVQSLEKNYDAKHMPIVTYENILLDGTHRASWLLHRYGPKYEVRVLKIRFASAPLFSKKTFFRILCNLIPIGKYRKQMKRKHGIV